MLSKKLISGLLAVLLLLSNSGFAFSVHFCGGEIASITTAYIDSEICAKPKQEPKACCAAPSDDEKPCCENKTVDLKKSNDVVVKVFSFALQAPFVPVTWHKDVEEITSLPTVDQQSFYFFDDHSPPLFQLYNQYIFYA